MYIVRRPAKIYTEEQHKERMATWCVGFDNPYETNLMNLSSGFYNNLEFNPSSLSNYRETVATRWELFSIEHKEKIIEAFLIYGGEKNLLFIEFLKDSPTYYKYRDLQNIFKVTEQEMGDWKKEYELMPEPERYAQLDCLLEWNKKVSKNE